jgi:ABC-type cobalamin/Fe3+-siderophores transport system ATPase subunit
MPCRDYEFDYGDRSVLSEQNDKLARIACNALNAFAKADPEAVEKFLSKNKEAREWWSKHQEADRAEKERKLEENRVKKLKKEALSKLSDEEKKALGL